MSGEEQKIFVGSRKSELALIQTKHVISLLTQIHPQLKFEIVTMSTLGDRILDIPLPKIGEKSLFTQELELALQNGQVDFVVHSLKDLPTVLPSGMVIGAVLTREDPRDALVLQKDSSNYLLESLPEGSVIGTSSLRRTAQLARKHPHLKVENIRGNLNTRLKKLDELGTYQAIILAAAGLKRMGWTKRITKILDAEDLLYAVGQGALAVECRGNDEKIIELLKPLFDLETSLRIIAERSFLKTLGGGCSAPVAVATEISKIKRCSFTLALKGAVWSLDGKEEILESVSCDLPLKDIKYCASCPYNDNGIRDIENFNNCSDCSFTLGEQPNPSKRAKLDNIPAELLKNDPHDKCPVQLPVGADFMGKCPYLDSEFLDAHSRGSLDITKCPFFNKDSSEISGGEPTTSTAVTGECLVKTYCGLVAHDHASAESQENALNLGIQLANVLIGKGAKEIMSAAQATIHKSVAVPVKNQII